MFTGKKIGARRLEKIIDFKHDRHISHNKIHEVLLEKVLAKENKTKKKRQKAWIRYERKHSLTAVHLDWHTGKVVLKEASVIKDDGSRYILACVEFDVADVEISINLVQEVMENIAGFEKSNR